MAGLRRGRRRRGFGVRRRGWLRWMVLSVVVSGIGFSSYALCLCVVTIWVHD